jgi:membrane protease YdiL (CAAX protease family)
LTVAQGAATPGSGGLGEPLAAFFVTTALCAGLYRLGQVVPVVGANLHAAIALLFLAAPAVAARLSRRPFDYETAGLRLDPIARGLKVLGGVVAVTWPLFLGGFLLYYGLVCAARGGGSWARIVDWTTPQCVRWRGLGGAQLTWPPEPWLSAMNQLLVVAVPEEMFFRGYLQGRLEERWAPSRQLWGAPVGRASLVSSALFAVGHVLVDFNPGRLAVFLPGLVFSWMRSRTGAIAAGALYHALCNVYSDVVHRSFFH